MWLYKCKVVPHVYAAHWNLSVVPNAFDLAARNIIGDSQFSRFTLAVPAHITGKCNETQTGPQLWRQPQDLLTYFPSKQWIRMHTGMYANIFPKHVVQQSVDM